MKKYYYCLITVLFFLLLSSCKEKVPVTRISVDNVKTEFFLNDRFTPGKDCKILVQRENDITEYVATRKCKFYINEIQLKHQKFKQTGKKTVTVSFENAEYTYDININDQGFIKRNRMLLLLISIPSIFILIFILKNILNKISRYSEEEKRKKIKIQKEKEKKERIKKQNLVVLRKIETEYDSTKKEREDNSIAAHCANVSDKVIWRIHDLNSQRFKKIDNKTPGKILYSDEFKEIVPSDITNKMEKIKKLRNSVVHDSTKLNSSEKSELITNAKYIIDWFRNNYCS